MYSPQTLFQMPLDANNHNILFSSSYASRCFFVACINGLRKCVPMIEAAPTLNKCTQSRQRPVERSVRLFLDTTIHGLDYYFNFPTDISIISNPFNFKSIFGSSLSCLLLSIPFQTPTQNWGY